MSETHSNTAKADWPRQQHIPTGTGGFGREIIDFPVIGIGASAGGLEACSKLLDASTRLSGIALILVQHLDPKHESMMVALLSRHTSLTVLEATHGMPIERDHLYIIPPASFLAIGEGALSLTPIQATRSSRLPFDFLLESMAEECGAHAVCVVLSGTGADGSIGLRAIKQSGGFVIVQEPTEAGYDGMPRSAIATGAVDLVLAVTAMPGAIIHRQSEGTTKTLTAKTMDWLPDIVELLRTRTPHNFTLYKPGTLKRRVERRMAMAAIGNTEMERYLKVLIQDPAEVEQLAKDLLIHVTSFFRDPAVFEALAKTLIPELIDAQQASRIIRIWVAGCSTGEEAYSLAIVFQEQIAAANSSVKLQIFASDADADAVAFARNGLYQPTVMADVNPNRLTAFFVKEDNGYRVIPELRAAVVFTVQDLLSDPS